MMPRSEDIRVRVSRSVLFARIYNATFATHCGTPQCTVRDFEGPLTGLSERHAGDLRDLA
jgi:hypothetical protein